MKARLERLKILDKGRYTPFARHPKEIILALLTCLFLPVHADSLRSPNGRIIATISGGKDIPWFNISYKDKNTTHVVDIETSGILTSTGMGDNLRITSISRARRINTSYDMPTGKRSHCTNRANAYDITMVGDSRDTVKLELRLYDDGIAFRYAYHDLSPCRVIGEATTYHITEGSKRWMQQWTDSYEGFFPLTTTGIHKDRHWNYPALIEAGPDVYALITESGIERFHSASTLRNDSVATDYRVTPATNTMMLQGDWHSPWRVVIIGTLGELTASTLVNDVALPAAIDVSRWVRAGTCSWPYWAYNHGSKDYQIVKKYIDMASDYHMPYILIDWEWDQMSNGGNFTDAIEYARKKGVKVWLWYNSSTGWLEPTPLYRLNKPEDREREMEMLEKMGVAGIKVDFFKPDEQEAMAYQIDILRSAARHHLMVDLHGTTLPRGWARTYPNLMTTEAVYGAEWYNNKATLTARAACHNATLPFTRNIVGSMDYTPCAFSDSQHPHITSNGHELALPIVFESGLMSLADKPESYHAQPTEVQHVLASLPASWDDTRLLAGKPGEYAVIARRKGDQWYIGGINGRDSTTMVSLDWAQLHLSPKTPLTFITDGEEERSWYITTAMAHRLPPTITMKARGGFVVVPFTAGK